MRAIDLHCIVGEYLADQRLSISDYSVSAAGSIDLTVDDSVSSVRYAYELAGQDRHRQVVNTPSTDGQRQIVSVWFLRADDVYVTVRSTHTDPDVITRLRAVSSGSALDNAANELVMTALSGWAEFAEQVALATAQMLDSTADQVGEVA